MNSDMIKKYFFKLINWLQRAGVMPEVNSDVELLTKQIQSDVLDILDYGEKKVEFDAEDRRNQSRI